MSETIDLRQRHYPALDGLRGLAALMVFADHYLGMVMQHPVFLPGWGGVEIFFVLSGFLITSRLVQTVGTPDYFRGFYLRRTLRIFPLYYLTWGLLLLLGIYPGIYWTRGLARWLIYLGNLHMPYRSSAELLFANSFLRLRGGSSVFREIVVGHFWTLCVEEQFYIVWPAVLLFVRGTRRIVTVCLCGAAAEVLLRLLFLPDFVHTEFVYHQTYLRLDGFLLGAALAAWVRGGVVSRPSFRAVRSGLLFGGGLPLAAYTAYELVRSAGGGWPTRDLGSHFTSTVGFSFVAMLSGGVLLLCLRPGWLAKAWLESSVLRYFGRISYGFYIVHNLPQAMFYRARPWLVAHGALGAAVAAWFVVCCVLATVSREVFEEPFLRLKDRLSRRRERLRSTAREAC